MDTKRTLIRTAGFREGLNKIDIEETSIGLKIRGILLGNFKSTHLLTVESVHLKDIISLFVVEHRSIISLSVG